MRRYTKEDFAWVYEDSGTSADGYEFEGCRFKNCGLGLSEKRRSVFRNARLINCEIVRPSACGPAFVEDVTIDGLKISGLQQVFGAAYKHVTLRGRIGRLMLSSTVPPASVDESEAATARTQRRLDAENEAYYAAVDWALDIRDGEFEELDLRGIPARLIRRDRETQFVVTRTRALEGAWRTADCGLATQVAMNLLLESGYADKVLIAAKRSKNFAERLAEFQALRARGIAEPE